VVIVDLANGSLDIRFAQRLPLGMSYATQLRRLGQILARCGPPGDNGLRVAIDRTGLGAPVLERAWEMLSSYSVIGVTITAGTSAHTVGRTWTVPKVDLVDSVALALESGTLRAAAGLSDLDALVDQLKGFSYTDTEGGGSTMGADASAAHDDMVVATALACYIATKGSGKGARMRLPDQPRTRRVPAIAELPPYPRDRDPRVVQRDLGGRR
jgi:hypothetical protein